jgi:hypothetical protein
MEGGLIMRRSQTPFNGKRFLLNINTGEIHDLDNETAECKNDGMPKRKWLLLLPTG